MLIGIFAAKAARNNNQDHLNGLVAVFEELVNLRLFRRRIH